MPYTIKKIFFFVLLFSTAILHADIPEGYYAEAEGKSGAELKTALHNIIRSHTVLNFNSSASIWWYTYYQKTDWHPDGYFWDMYSNDRYSGYSGTRQNREHCMPRSWWGESSDYPKYDANGDLHNLYPSEKNANLAKGNHPLGITNGENFNNGVSKVGANTYPGYTGTVFEPSDMYKGDFARTYMYMVTCYQDYAPNWKSLGTRSMLNNNTYPTFKSYAINLLMKWHHEDAVSPKEINRNDAVYSLQLNRNPFIDYPELAEFIWGSFSEEGEIWFPGASFPGLSVYPNPAGSYITLNVSRRPGEDVYYEIYSINGLAMMKGILNTDNTIQIGELGGGMYILVVYSAGRRMTTKFIAAGGISD